MPLTEDELTPKMVDPYEEALDYVEHLIKLERTNQHDRLKVTGMIRDRAKKIKDKQTLDMLNDIFKQKQL